ncbi:snRNA-activating protein of 50kDa MW C terminal-domain-containing protein [Pilobolus umbonatus]|nr:snRNA-activating protein of 50kDa MW C terminal-domain-containing protein [Pilobolus umbonatus]
MFIQDTCFFLFFPPFTMTLPKHWREEFNTLLKEQTAIEQSSEFRKKRDKYNPIELSSKYDLTALSEIFQDPNFLSKISEESHKIMNKAVRLPRIRHSDDIVTTKKPQAKDVLTGRVVEEEEESVSTAEDEFISPLAPKRRKFIAHSNEQEETTEGSIELFERFKEISSIIQTSQLKSISSKYLYTLLPRQRDSYSYKYMKDDFSSPHIPHIDPRKELFHSEDTVLTFTFYVPEKPWQKFQEIEILGSSLLSDLRDSIYCLMDFSCKGDRKGREEEGVILNTTMKKLSTSVFYMDHVFYIDTRAFEQEEYAGLIQRWLKMNKVKKDFQYQIIPMHTAPLESITLPLNIPCAFIHQDTCEHMFMVRDIRLLKHAEPHSEYPRTVHSYKYTRYKCSLCTVFPAK